MNEEIKKFTYRFNSFYNGVFITALLVCVFAWACDNFYIGKSEEDIEKEIYESMFEIDTTIGRIKIMLGDSSSVNK